MNRRVEGNLRIAAALTAAERGAAEKISSEFLDAQMALSAPRMLMSELKVMMQSPLPPTEKLREIVKKVVTGLRGDAGACFITRPGEMLEVYASVGFDGLLQTFKPVPLGDGLVGDIAAQASPYFLSDMQGRPETATPRPETPTTAPSSPR